MNAHVEKLLNEFKENEECLAKLKVYVMDLLNLIIRDEQKILLAGLEGRIKTYDSLKGKLELKGDKYKSIYDITDLFGARIITFYNDEVDIIASLIEKTFEIDYENSIDKRKVHDVDRFGYMSLHYICKVPKSLFYDEKFPMFNEIRFEIQMRTCLQHVWATIFHDTGYKSDIEVPREYIRKLARLEGLLEIADDEFITIRNQINSYRKKIRSLVSQGNFKDVSLNIDSYKNYIALEPFKALIDKIAAITNAEVEYVSYIKYYDSFISLGFTTLNDIEQFRIANSEDAYKLSLIKLGGTDIDIISSTIAMQNLLIVYIFKKYDWKEQRIEMLEKVFDKKFSDREFEKLIEDTKSIILM